MSGTPSENGSRQKDHKRTNARAKRLRRTPTPAELQLWKILRVLNKEGLHFRRQMPLGDHVFDFGDYSRQILIEVDGGVHRLPDVALNDHRKMEWATSQGFSLLRFSNREVLGGPEEVLKKIRAACF